MAKFTEVLRNKNFFFLWLGQIISQFGDRLNQMALIALIYNRAPGSTFQLAKLLSFTILPVFLIGPIAGAYVDRWNRRNTMVVCDFLRGLLILAIPLSLIRLDPIFPVYMAVFLVFSITRFFLPAKLAIIPDLVPEKHLLLANSLATTTGMIACVFGFGLGGLLVAAVGVKGGFYVDSLTYFISGCLLLMIVAKRAHLVPNRIEVKGMVKEFREVIERSVLLEIKEGLNYIVRQKETRFIVSILFFLWSALGAVYVVAIVFIQKTLGSATKDLGLLVMFLGAGLFLGSLAYGRFGQRTSRTKVIFLCLTLSGILISLFAILTKLFPSFPVASSLVTLLGMSVSPIMISSNTLIHEVIHNEMRGRIFSSLEIVMHLSFLIFMFITAALAERISRMWILICIGLIFALFGLVSLRRGIKNTALH